jgi:hypothetical protein
MRQLLETPTGRHAATRGVQQHGPRMLAIGLGLIVVLLLLVAGVGGGIAGAAVQAPDGVAQDEGSSDTGGDGGTTGGDGGSTGSDTGTTGGGGDTGGGDGSSGDGTESKLTTEDWILLGIIGVLAIVVIMGVTSLASHHTDKKTAAKASLNSRLGEIVGAARWVHDQGSIEILRLTDARQLASSWSGVRERIVDLEARISVLANETHDGRLEQALLRLGQTAAGLRGALESSVSLRLGADAAYQTDLIQDARRTVDERRRQFGQAIEPVAAAQR